MLHNFNSEDREYLQEVLDALAQNPDIVSEETELDMGAMVKSIIENLKLGGPWDSGLGIETGQASDKECVNTVWDLMQTAFNNEVPIPVAVRLLNPVYNPTSLIDHVADSEIDELHPKERFSLLLEATISCLDQPRIADWVRTSLMSVAVDALLLDDSVDSGEDTEAWETDTKSAEEIIAGNKNYSMLLHVLDLNTDSDNDIDVEEEEEEIEELDTEPMQMQDMVQLISTIIAREQREIKGLPDFLQEGYVVGMVEEEARGPIDLDTVYELVEAALGTGETDEAE